MEETDGWRVPEFSTVFFHPGLWGTPPGGGNRVAPEALLIKIRLKSFFYNLIYVFLLVEVLHMIKGFMTIMSLP